MWRLAFLLVFFAAGAQADEAISICFNYGCAAEELAVFSDTRLMWVSEILGAADSAEQERRLISAVVGQLYGWAGQQTPVHADRAGNVADEGVRGAMDCIDHSTTTTRFLRLLERRGALRFHRVLEPARRGWIFEHLSAQIEEIGSRRLDADPGDVGRFAVDSWYVDNGRPPPIIPLEFWREGNESDV